ncbi:hypothetical protein G9F72_023020 [Clostridium estertheticum]|uniref:hypothetical protein n=1 Tax=Clostridium estertheticum TaxID=238834 RepID=UPI001CD15E19|nr:hypothetical protein [Clostridium estertheticum]MBZ9689174.1 hypothetical protein [Clostridium estertheticum]
MIILEQISKEHIRHLNLMCSLARGYVKLATCHVDGTSHLKGIRAKAYYSL